MIGSTDSDRRARVHELGSTSSGYRGWMPQLRYFFGSTRSGPGAQAINFALHSQDARWFHRVNRSCDLHSLAGGLQKEFQANICCIVFLMDIVELQVCHITPLKRTGTTLEPPLPSTSPEHCLSPTAPLRPKTKR